MSGQVPTELVHIPAGHTRPNQLAFALVPLAGISRRPESETEEDDEESDDPGGATAGICLLLLLVWLLEFHKASL